MEIVMQFLPAGVLYLLTLAFGLWLGHIGRPYNGILFNFHKLVALGGVVLTVIQVIKVLKTPDTPTLIIGLIVVAGLCVVALFATGAFLSIGKPDIAIIKPIHQAALVLLPVSMGVTVYLLAAGS
jgi:hypothetical protein